jgi:hypothetical protein
MCSLQNDFKDIMQDRLSHSGADFSYILWSGTCCRTLCPARPITTLGLYILKTSFLALFFSSIFVTNILTDITSPNPPKIGLKIVQCGAQGRSDKVGMAFLFGSGANMLAEANKRMRPMPNCLLRVKFFPTYLFYFNYSSKNFTCYFLLAYLIFFGF